MSSSVIENSTSNVEKTIKSPETTAPQASTTNTSPWETLDHQPGALKTKSGNKLLTIEDALKKNGTNNSSTKTQNHSFKQSKIEQVSIPVKKEDEEQWNPVDLTHLLITDAPPRSSKNGNGRFKNGNNGSKRTSDTSSKSDRNRSRNNNKREGKEKLPNGENKKQSESGEYKKNSSSNFSKSNNNNNKESNSFRKNKYHTPKLNVSDEKKPLNEDSKAKEENKKEENVVKSSEPVEQLKEEEKEQSKEEEKEEENQVDKESKDGETNKESDPKQFNGEYQPRFSSNFKSKKPYTEGSSNRYPRKPFNPNHKHYSNDHYNSENKKPYEKRPYQPRTYNNRYNNNSYQNRSYSNSQQPIILPIYQKQFPYEVYHECAKQLAYYLSVENLEKDEFMVKNLIDKNGYVQLSQLLNFKKLKQLSENGNFEIVMTAIFIILSQQLDETNDVEVALLDSMSEYIATDVYGNKNPYDCYILRNLKWISNDFEFNPRVFNPVTAFGVNDFISYSIQKPIVLEQEKEEEKKN